MATYQIFLWAGDEPANVSINAICDSDQEAREIARRMLMGDGTRDGRAEVWIESKSIAAIVGTRALK
jgi:hypothetical protein